MAQREQFTQQVAFADAPATLYACAGKWDDYVELTLPADCVITESQLAALRRHGTEELPELDARATTGQERLLCLLINYTPGCQLRQQPLRQRLQGPLARLAAALPQFDAGDLLPEQPAAEDMSSALTMETAAQTERPDATTLPAAGGLTTAQGERDNAGLFAAARFTSEARQLAMRGLNVKANRLLDKALRLCPDYDPALDLRGQLKTLARREKQYRRQPRNTQAALEVGFSYLCMQRYTEAEPLLRLAAQPTDCGALTVLLHGISLHGCGHAEAARAVYQRAARLGGDKKALASLLDSLEKGEAPPLLVDDTPAGSGASPCRPAGQQRGAGRISA